MRRVPGEGGLWIVVLGDVTAFLVLFGMVLSYRDGHPEVWAAGQAHVRPGFGFAETLLLLSSSLAAVAAVNASRLGQAGTASRAFRGAQLLGLAFVVAKAIEWRLKAHDGLTPDTDPYWLLYFGLTGLHLLHVVLGLGVLELARRIAARGAPGPHDPGFVQGGAVFWHMVDLLWLVLFPVVYLVR